LINGNPDYLVDISTTIQALQVLAGSQDYNGRRRNRNVKGNRRANSDYAELVDNSVKAIIANAVQNASEHYGLKSESYGFEHIHHLVKKMYPQIRKNIL
jgi:hypothetical protein